MNKQNENKKTNAELICSRALNYIWCVFENALELAIVEFGEDFVPNK